MTQDYAAPTTLSFLGALFRSMETNLPAVMGHGHLEQSMINYVS